MPKQDTQRSRFTASELGLDETAISSSFIGHVEYTQGKDEYSATRHDYLMSLAHAVRDRLVDR